MGFDSDLTFVSTWLKVFAVDLLLSGDNAVVIALACRSLPPRQRRRAMLCGTGAAILLRIYLATVVSYLMDIPGMKLVGAAALLIIAIKLLIEEEKKDGPLQPAGEGTVSSAQRELLTAIVLIVIADLVMSVDNMVALTATAKGDLLVLGLGLILSIPLLMYGSQFVAVLFRGLPLLVTMGGALLGWIAGDIMASDSLLAGWIDVEAPALPVAMPIICAVFVLAESRIIQHQSSREPAPPPPRRTFEPSGAESPREETTAASGLSRFIARELRRRSLRRGKEAPSQPAFLSPARDEAMTAEAVILVAEDNPMDLAKLRQALERLGYVVDTASNGRLALEMIEAFDYGLLIADQDLRVDNGDPLAAHIRSRETPIKRRLPIIGVVGYISNQSAGRQCLDIGMDAWLRKPVRADQLDASIKALLPVAATLRRPPAPVMEG